MMILVILVVLMASSVWADAMEWVYGPAENYKYRCGGDPFRCEVWTAETERFHKEECYQRMQEVMRTLHERVSIAREQQFQMLPLDMFARQWDDAIRECVTDPSHTNR